MFINLRRFLFRRRRLRMIREKITKSRESRTPVKPLQLSRAMSPPSPTHSRADYTAPGPMAWQYQIAALTIQLAWRQYLRKKIAKKAAQKKPVVHEWTPSVLAQKQRMRVMEIYGSPAQAKKFQPPPPKPMYRPAHFKFIVPAAVMSYNFAVGSYVKQSDYAMLRRRKLRTAVTRGTDSSSFSRNTSSAFFSGSALSSTRSAMNQQTLSARS